MVIALLGAAISACSSEKENPLTAAYEKMAAAESMAASMETAVGMNLEGEEEVILTTYNTISLIQKPLLVKIETYVSDGTTDTDITGMYIQETDKTFDTYQQGSGRWFKESFAKEKTAFTFDKYDPVRIFQQYIAVAGEPVEAGEEEMDGILVKKYTSVIPADQVLGVAQSSKVFEYAGMRDLSSQYFTGIDDLPFTVWIGEETGLPVKYSADYTEIFQKITDNLAEASAAGGNELVKIIVPTYTYTVNCLSYNQVEPFAVSEEAKKAVEAKELPTAQDIQEALPSNEETEKQTEQEEGNVELQPEAGSEDEGLKSSETDNSSTDSAAIQ